MKDAILATVGDLVSDFVYYDRKNDEELPAGSIKQAVKNGDVSVDEIVEFFKSKLIKALD